MGSERLNILGKMMQLVSGGAGWNLAAFTTMAFAFEGPGSTLGAES